MKGDEENELYTIKHYPEKVRLEVAPHTYSIVESQRAEVRLTEKGKETNIFMQDMDVVPQVIYHQEVFYILIDKKIEEYPGDPCADLAIYRMVPGLVI